MFTSQGRLIMVSKTGRQLKFSSMLLLSTILPTVAAHGGEEEPATLSNSQVLIIASLTAILVYFLVNKFLASRQAVFPTSIICLASFTGLVHILLGLEDSKLLLGGIGVMGLIALPMVINLDEQKGKLVSYSLILLIGVMFVAYFVSNHDLHYISEDYLGIVTKLIEVSVIVVLAKEMRTKITSKT